MTLQRFGNNNMNNNNSDDYHLHFNQDGESLLRIRQGSKARDVRRQSSLVRPERNRLNDPNDPHFYYAQKAQEQKGKINVQPSSTGLDPNMRFQHSHMPGSRSSSNNRISISSNIYQMDDFNAKEIDEDEAETGDNHNTFDNENDNMINNPTASKTKNLRGKKPESLSFWQMYYYIITFWAPAPLLALCGMPKKERQQAWRDKIALISLIFCLGAMIAFLIFGFSRTVCKSSELRFNNDDVSINYLIINGKAYNLESSSHPGVVGIENGVNVLYPPINAGGMDATFLFQNVNGNCLDLIKPRENTTTPYDQYGNMAWYFPCKLFKTDGSTKPNFTASEYYEGWACHTSEESREAYYALESSADIFFSWDDIKNSTRNLIVYNGHVLDLDLLDWLETDQLTYPSEFDDIRTSNFQGYDISLSLTSGHEKKIGRCLTEIIRVGEIDSRSLGCIASDVVLYVSLVFILSVVILKFLVASYFRWFVARKQGAFEIDNKTMEKHLNEIEDWSENIYSQGPIPQANKHYRSNTGNGNSTFGMVKDRKSKLFPLNENTSDLNNTSTELVVSGTINGLTTMSTQNSSGSNDIVKHKKLYNARNQSALLSASSLLWSNATTNPIAGASEINSLDPTGIHPEAVQQPPLDFMPFNIPLIHSICFITCYSEDEEGIRSTLDSLATTDYPNSHKLLMVVCDGLIKGHGNDRTTPEIVLDMVEDFVVPREEVQGYSYVAVASGSKRHNMAKIYAGFYRYDDSLVSEDKQQHVPIIVIVKCGTQEEQASAKPGNRGKRDSQIILMSFLQKVTFEERMSELEFQMMKSIWQLTGLMPDFYESVLMVDADTRVFPDSITHMIAEMVRDPSIMGLCGETKIANKLQSWVTTIQVFEYYISHHQSKAFESVFGSVTCLPGCFSMYRIKSPKGSDGYWVPILANPDIVERYSDNVTDTLHKKNLLLLGEDRYLSYLMLRTFPKRKQVFVAKAVCKTTVPDEFKVLLSQRRRWINSTVHNLFELILIKDLCGTFCFSMQFVIGIELIGTLVLPLALCFTVYVIIFAITSTPTPILTLLLLAMILGLPAVLVVVTATRLSYLMWLVIYIIALPIWNFVLPSYAFWKFDDFSWGDTRTIEGGNSAAGGHAEVEGEFDHSKIKMRTWREFERKNIIDQNQI